MHRAYWIYNRVRVTLDGITHAARLYPSSGVVATVCGVPAGKGDIYQLGILETSVPNVDCMSCLVAEGKAHAK